MADKECAFFVGVKDPAEVRRYVLETARDSIQTLQLFEKVKAIRDEKAKLVAELKSNVKSISRLLSKAKSVLPKAKLRVKLHEHESTPEAMEEEIKSRGKKKGKKKAVVLEKPTKGELDKLEDDLSAIEGKLNSLS